MGNLFKFELLASSLLLMLMDCRSWVDNISTALLRLLLSENLRNFRSMLAKLLPIFFFNVIVCLLSSDGIKRHVILVQKYWIMMRESCCLTCFPKGSSIHNLWSSHVWLRFLSNTPRNSASLLCTVPFRYSKAESILDFIIKIRMYRSDNKRELEYFGHCYGVQSVKVCRLGILAESRDSKGMRFTVGMTLSISFPPVSSNLERKAMALKVFPCCWFSAWRGLHGAPGIKTAEGCLQQSSCGKGLRFPAEREGTLTTE